MSAGRRMALVLGDTRVLLLSAMLRLAAAGLQPARFAVPLVIASVWRHRGAAPPLAAPPLRWPESPSWRSLPRDRGRPYVTGVFAPILLPIEAHGVSLAWLGAMGAVPLLDRGVSAALALAAAGVAVIRRHAAAPGIAVLALAPVYLAWRASRATSPSPARSAR